MKQVYTCYMFEFFGGELYLELFESSFPARDPSFSRVGFALKTKQPVNTGVFKYMAKPAKGRTSTRLLQVDHDQPRFKDFILLVIYQNHKTGSMAFVQPGMKWKEGTSRRLERLLEFEFIQVTYEIVTGYTSQNEQHTFLKLVLGKL